MTTEQTGSERHTLDQSLQKKELEKKSSVQIYVSFALMLALTAFSFIAVGSEVIPAGFAIPFILLMAFIQVVLQFALFMHLNEKGSEFPILFIIGAFFVALLTIAALLLLIWW